MSGIQVHLLLNRIAELTAELAEQDRTLPICSAVQDDECLSVRGKWPSHACGFREGHDGSHHCESCFYEWGGGSHE